MCSFITFWACRATKGKAGEAGSLGCGDHQGDCSALSSERHEISSARGKADRVVCLSSLAFGVERLWCFQLFQPTRC